MFRKDTFRALTDKYLRIKCIYFKHIYYMCLKLNIYLHSFSIVNFGLLHRF